jgi:hypothetical protein
MVAVDRRFRAERPSAFDNVFHVIIIQPSCLENFVPLASTMFKTVISQTSVKLVLFDPIFDTIS